MSNGPLFPAGAVPIPNRLLDEVLPTLRDSELRVLLIVLRQTVGWREGSDTGGWRYKERDWISHSQLVRRTGRGGEAVSMAVDALVRQGHIVVEDQAGRSLLTSSERRRHLGRLYFRPGDMWITVAACRPGKSETTTDTPNNIKREEKTKKQQKALVRGGGWLPAAAIGNEQLAGACKLGPGR